MSEITRIWFEEGKKLKIGQAIFIRVASKKEQTAIAKALEKEKESYTKVEPMLASQLFIAKTLKNLKPYVIIERKYRSPYIAFLKDTDGTLSKLTIDPERRRQIRLMLKDKRPREEIEDCLNGLTEEEIAEFYPLESKE